MIMLLFVLVLTSCVFTGCSQRQDVPEKIDLGLALLIDDDSIESYSSHRHLFLREASEFTSFFLKKRENALPKTVKISFWDKDFTPASSPFVAKIVIENGEASYYLYDPDFEKLRLVLRESV